MLVSSGRGLDACRTASAIPAVALTGTRTFSSSSSSGSSSSRSAGGSPSGSDSDSDTDPVARLGIHPAELGPNGELPWYYTDSNVKAAWQITDQQELQYWQEVMENVQKPKVQQSLAQLDLRQRLGLPFAVPKQLKQPSGWGWFRRAKSRNPMAVALVKVGAFYEAAGLDALLLVEHAGLNLMGSNLEVPRAGCPEANLLALLRVLVEERGLSVAVWEEMASGAEYGRRSKDQKQRFFSQLVTPENPAYLHGYADSASDRDVNVPTLCGVSGSISGLSVYRLNRAAAAVEVFKGLSEDGLWGLLAADSSAPGVVYLHRPYSQLQQASTAYASDADRTQAALAKRLKAAGMRVHMYAGADPLAAFKEQVATALAMPAAQLTTRQARDMGSWPGLLPLYLSTLLQLGLLRNRGIPGLVDYLVPDDAPRAVREALAALLSAPPPHEVAAATRQALRGMLCYEGALPGWQCGGVTPKKVAVVLQAGEAPEKFFQALAATLQPVVSSLDPATCPPALAAIVKDLWPLLLHTMPAEPQQLSHSAVLAACRDALAAISRVVAQPGSSSSSGSSGSAAADGMPPEDAVPAEEQVVTAFAARQERFHSRVVTAAIQPQADQVDVAYDALLTVIEDLLRTLRAAANSGRSAGKPIAAEQLLHADDTNVAIWLKLPTKELQALAGKPLNILPARPGEQQQGRVQHLRAPYDRNGSVHKKQDLRTCDELDAALNAYRTAVAAANAAATCALKELTKELAGSATQLAAAVQLGDLLNALLYHSRAATAAGWTVPYVGAQEQQQYLQQQQKQQRRGGKQLAVKSASSSSSSSSRGAFYLKELWPFWMVGSDSSTIKNDVALDGFMLLTGPNMAGKSTVLRAVAAAALCGCVGLAVPAAPGSSLPCLDAVVLRTFSGDAPQEGLSAFGVEMKEMTDVLGEVRPHSLVLVDELGKGTEAVWGTALAAAILQQLAASGASGIFATHLHLLLPLLEGEPRLQPYKMAVRERQQQQQQQQQQHGLPCFAAKRFEPTMRLEPGACTESLALEPQPQPWPDAQQLDRLSDPAAAAAAAAAAAGSLRGVVHHLAPRQQPPPSHERGSWVYVLRHSRDVWYVGESQGLRLRRRQHMSARSKQLDMWYVALGSHQDRRVVQGRLIRALDGAGFKLDTRHDAHFARKK
ncbi:hypothetical protein OEZ85_014061 [Tetradesmus obliquus]|uniref:DNA mismatch repair proteins mutS family domain-containing protein n=1 Tax=Tetradesmus obliquus TaxID=3088 RepID=A0ABY8UBX3_TETOB|nr:hypothetical protein OEZ85_014061 [Tetradesmus obliquus]